MDENNLTDNTNKNYLNYIEANAFLYAVNSNAEAGYKAISGIKAYLKSFNAIPGSNGASRNGSYMVFVASLVYDWCYDLMTTSEKEEIVNSCILNLGKTEVKWPPTAGVYTNGHGEETMVPYMLAFGIAIYDEYP